MKPACQPISGAALLLVLWAIAVLSFSVLWVAHLVTIDLEIRSADARRLAARQLALSGVALASHPQVTREDVELLNRDFPDGSKMRVRIRGEGARFNINQLLDPPDRITLKNLFILWGLSNDESDVLIDRLIDWVDDDAGRQLHGAERAEYEALGIMDAPANRPFRSVDEMGRVLGMDVLTQRHPAWREAFTVFGDGRIDVNEAPADILQVATGLTPELVEDILAWRRGDDGIEPSEDDRPFESLADLRGWLQASPFPQELLESRLTTESAVKRIDSAGIVDKSEVRISVVAAAGQEGQTGEYLLWEER